MSVVAPTGGGPRARGPEEPGRGREGRPRRTPPSKPGVEGSLTKVAGAGTTDTTGFGTVVAAASQGEQWALTQLFRAYQPMLVRYLRGQARDHADDMAGEVWVAVAQRLRQFDDDELGFRRWLFTIARRRVIEHHRKATRRRTDPVPNDDLNGPDHGGMGVDPASIVLERLSAQDAVDLIVADLPRDQAEAVLLRVVAGFDVAEVAQIMGRTAGSVRVLCHRALRRLAARFPEGVLVE